MRPRRYQKSLRMAPSEVCERERKRERDRDLRIESTQQPRAVCE